MAILEPDGAGTAACQVLMQISAAVLWGVTTKMLHEDKEVQDPNK